AAAGGQPGRRAGVTGRGLGTRGLVAAQPGISRTARAELRRPPKPATGGTPRGTGPVAVFHANGCRGCRGQRSGSRYVTVGKSRMSVFRTSCSGLWLLCLLTAGLRGQDNLPETLQFRRLYVPQERLQSGPLDPGVRYGP